MNKVGINKFLYTDVPVDADGWADAKKYMPDDYHLCSLKIKDRDKIQPGWASKLSWDGVRVSGTDEVLYWKLRKEQRER